MGIDATSIGELEKTFEGVLIQPSDPVYDDTRTIFNAMIDRRPALIAQPNTPADVAAAIAFARAHDVPIAVRSGGHSVAGMSLCDGGVVIDMRAMNAVTVDAGARTARCGGGTQWGTFDAATTAHGLATTGGRVSSTGVAGLTLGGGSGWLERAFGLACDNLRAVELVTASGELVRATATENPDLFWALHGGGGNFGVATALEFNLHPVPDFYVGLLLYTRDKAPKVARAYRDFADKAPREVGGGMAFLTAPPEEFVPAELQGTVVFGVIYTFIGTQAEAEAVLQPFLDVAPPDVPVTMPAPYFEFQHMLDDPPGFRNYWTAEYLDTLPDEAIDVFVSFGMKQKPSPTQLILLPWGGAVADVAEEATPMTKRHSTWVFHPLALWESASDDAWWIDWSRSAASAVRKYASGGVYLNFVGDEGEDRIVAAFGKDKYERLAEIKAHYDPDNVFQFNQNIKPRPAPAPIG